MLNFDLVNFKSIRLGNIDMRDYPDFCDAMIEEACFIDGTWLSDEEMQELENHVDMNELAHNQVF